MFVPYVVEDTERGETRHDIYSRLLKDRIIMLTTGINADVASVVVAQLLFLSSVDPDSDIKMYINSPGGSVISGMSIYDCMQMVKPDIETVVIGQAASMGSLLLAGGTKGKRKILPHSTVLLHQPLMNGLSGQASDIQIHAEDILKWKGKLNGILAERTGQTLEKIVRDTDRDFILDAEQALQYGIVDSIIGK
jgi:ATP-dependent Clp protease, protease subunit